MATPQNHMIFWRKPFHTSCAALIKLRCSECRCFASFTGASANAVSRWPAAPCVYSRVGPLLNRNYRCLGVSLYDLDKWLPMTKPRSPNSSPLGRLRCCHNLFHISLLTVVHLPSFLYSHSKELITSVGPNSSKNESDPLRLGKQNELVMTSSLRCCNLTLYSQQKEKWHKNWRNTESVFQE